MDVATDAADDATDAADDVFATEEEAEVGTGVADGAEVDGAEADVVGPAAAVAAQEQTAKADDWACRAETTPHALITQL